MRRFVVFKNLMLMAVIAVAAFAFVSCESNYAYDHYRSVDIEGWNRNDTLDFDIGRLPRGTYDICIGFRATSSYPYRELGFDINSDIYKVGPKGKSKPATSPTRTVHKRVKCTVFDDEGRMVGKSGISADDFSYRVGSITLSENDSVVISVAHGMNQEIMPGLTQIGIQLMPAQ